MMTRVRKGIQFGLGALLLASLAVVAVFVVFYFQVVRQRHQAEILFQHVKELEPGKSTLQDARNVLQQFGNNPHQDHCDEHQCQISVGIYAFQGRYLPEIVLIRSLGLRPASYSVTVDVKDGVVYRTHIYVMYGVNSGGLATVGSHFITEFNAFDRCDNPELQRHSEYALSFLMASNHSDAAFVSVGATPKATTDERSHARSIDLRCITRPGKCSPVDIMPQVYNDSLDDANWKRKNKVVEDPEQCNKMVRDQNRPELFWWSQVELKNFPRN